MLAGKFACAHVWHGPHSSPLTPKHKTAPARHLLSQMRDVGALLQRLTRENAEFLSQRNALAAQLNAAHAELEQALSEGDALRAQLG